jgi:RNA polymerase sigma factor (sigma-70 family)
MLPTDRPRGVATIGFDGSRPFSCYPEARIVALAQAGDGSAFAELVYRNYDRAQRLAYQVARNHAIAEDAVGSSFYRAFTRLSQFESTGTFSSWLSRIIINECRETARSARRALPVEFEERLHSPECIPQARHTWTPEEQTGRAELLAALAEEIRRIPDKLRGPLLMRVQGHSLTQIAARLGLKESAVKGRLTRARNHLRRRMARYLPQRATRF